MESPPETWREHIRLNWKHILRNFAIFVVVFYVGFWVLLFLFVGPPQEHLFSYLVTPGIFMLNIICAVLSLWGCLGPPKSKKDDEVVKDIANSILQLIEKPESLEMA
jgi:hypothetical protein